MRRAIAVPAIFALAACNAPAADGYRYGQAEFERDRIELSVVTHPDLASLRAAAPVDGEGLQAWGRVAMDRPACTIHIVEPANDYRPEFIGHEIVHCLRGRWHE